MKCWTNTPFSIQVNGEWQTFPNVKAAEEASYEEYKANLRRTAENFHITDDHLGEGGPKAKFQANVEAIKLLNTWRKPPEAGNARTAENPFPVCGLGRPLPMPLTRQGKLEQGICPAEGAADPRGICRCQRFYPQRALHQPYGHQSDLRGCGPYGI